MKRAREGSLGPGDLVKVVRHVNAATAHGSMVQLSRKDRMVVIDINTQRLGQEVRCLSQHGVVRLYWGALALVGKRQSLTRDDLP